MNPSYRIGWIGFRVMYATYFRWRVFGAENVPQTGGVILASNHASFLDPPLVGAGLNRDINYLARESLFRFPGIGALLRSWNSVPVDRDGGRARFENYFGTPACWRRDYFVSRRHAHAGREIAAGAFRHRADGHQI
jgi:1-acyl-sn-glycerol-3-phosphate acyltransferase